MSWIVSRRHISSKDRVLETSRGGLGGRETNRCQSGHSTTQRSPRSSRCSPRQNLAAQVQSLTRTHAGHRHPVPRCAIGRKAEIFALPQVRTRCRLYCQSTSIITSTAPVGARNCPPVRMAARSAILDSTDAQDRAFEIHLLPPSAALRPCRA